MQGNTGSAYVHIPFCRHRCGYCNFTLITRREDLVDSYLDSLDREMKQVDSGVLETLYIGGGTPSHLSLPEWNRLGEILSRRFQFSSDCEFTVEANPLDIEAEKVQRWKELGVNRISLGVQSFQADKLKLLERDHDRASALEAIELAKQVIGRVSVDLIFGTPGESLETWEDDLNLALSGMPGHVSTYNLTFEKGTSFWNRLNKGELNELGEEQAIRHYEFGISRLGSAGYEHYEVSNFSKPGDRSRHNEACWMGRSYYGFGAGAARFVEGVRASNHRSTTTYIKRIQSTGDATVEREAIDDELYARERLIFGLRRIQGIDLSEFESELGRSVDDLTGDRVQRFCELGLLERIDHNLRMTRKGLLVSDSIWPELL